MTHLKNLVFSDICAPNSVLTQIDGLLGDDYDYDHDQLDTATTDRIRSLMDQVPNRYEQKSFTGEGKFTTILAFWVHADEDSPEGWVELIELTTRDDGQPSTEQVFLGSFSGDELGEWVQGATRIELVEA